VRPAVIVVEPRRTGQDPHRKKWNRSAKSFARESVFHCPKDGFFSRGKSFFFIIF